jgi:spermidine/putrescine transport system permease protein
MTTTTPAPPPPTAAATRPSVLRRIRSWFGNPWGRPRFLVLITWSYMIWAIIPVLIAVQYSFNDSRSRTIWAGFSTRWYISDPSSVINDPTLSSALQQSLKLAAADVVIATPIGVCLALGLARWRGRGSGVSNFIMLFPLVTPEIVMGVSLLLVFTNLFTFIHTGTFAQILGHVTFSISYVVVIVRGRLFSIGKQYEEAAADLGASPRVALTKVLLPLLTPAIVAGAAICFAISIDDFVISYWLSNGGGSTTVPMVIYSATRAAPLPSTNAIATILSVITLASVVLGYVGYRIFTRGERQAGQGMVGDMAAFDI